MALLEAIPDESMKSAAKYPMPFLPKRPSRGILTSAAHERGPKLVRPQQYALRSLLWYRSPLQIEALCNAEAPLNRIESPNYAS